MIAEAAAYDLIVTSDQDQVSAKYDQPEVRAAGVGIEHLAVVRNLVAALAR